MAARTSRRVLGRQFVGAPAHPGCVLRAGWPTGRSGAVRPSAEDVPASLRCDKRCQCTAATATGRPRTRPPLCPSGKRFSCCDVVRDTHPVRTGTETVRATAHP
jgi:hypothetical protein